MKITPLFLLFFLSVGCDDMVTVTGNIHRTDGVGDTSITILGEVLDLTDGYFEVEVEDGISFGVSVQNDSSNSLVSGVIDTDTFDGDRELDILVPDRNDLRSGLVTSDSVVLRWDASEHPDFASFEILSEVEDFGGDVSEVALGSISRFETTNSQVTNTTITGLAPDTSYRFLLVTSSRTDDVSFEVGSAQLLVHSGEASE